MRVLWSPLASKERAHAILWALDHFGAEAAVALDERLERASRLLADVPRPGRPGQEPGTLEFVLPVVPYILVYRVQATRVEVVRLRHTARR